MTIKEFDKLIEEDKKKKEALSAEVEELVRQECQLNAEAMTAANAGDVDTYIAKKAAKDKVSATLFVKRKCLDRLGDAVTKEDSRAAWKDYASDYNKRMKKALADFNAEKAKLCKMYSDMVDLQRDALATRERLAVTVDDDKNAYTMEFIPVRDGNDCGSIGMSAVGYKDPDAIYYLSDYAQRNNKNFVPIFGEFDPEYIKITSVVINHNSR